MCIRDSFSNAGVKGLITRDDLDSCFPDFIPYISGCQFRSCSHLHEPDCSVKQALLEGSILGSRFESYQVLYGEL